MPSYKSWQTKKWWHLLKRDVIAELPCLGCWFLQESCGILWFFFSSFWRGAVIGLPPESSQERGLKNRSVWSSVEINVGYKNKFTSYCCPYISALLFNIIIMVCCHCSSSSSTGSSPLGIVIEFRRSLQQPPTSLSPSHTHTHCSLQQLRSAPCLSLLFVIAVPLPAPAAVHWAS